MLKEEFSTLPVFKGLTPQQLRLLNTILDLCKFPKGLVIFEQGQMASNLFLLLSGEVVINYKPYDGPILTVARIHPGGVFGWSAALGRDAYTSAAIAEEESQAFRMNGAELHRFCEKNPDIGRVLLDQLAGVIAERLRNTHDEILAILTKGMDLSDNCKRRLNDNG